MHARMVKQEMPLNGMHDTMVNLVRELLGLRETHSCGRALFVVAVAVWQGELMQDGMKAELESWLSFPLPHIFLKNDAAAQPRYDQSGRY